MARKKSKKPKNINNDISPEHWHELYRPAILRPDLVPEPASTPAPMPAPTPALRPVSDMYARETVEEAQERSRWYGLKKRRQIGLFLRAEEVQRTFSPGERMLLYLFSAILGLSALFMVGSVNALATVTLPSPGGSLVEGEVGTARFLNPLLTLSTPDQDITALVYSGLMRMMPDGTLVPDLASDYTISEDGRVYTFTLRPGVTFHDGTPVTPTDIAFTVARAQDPAVNSDRRADWTGVTVSAPDDRTIVFTLPRAYAPFIQNTTLGILPHHLWQNVSPEEFPFSTLNTHPVGSGPYKISKITEDATGAPLRYDLVPFKKYALGSPYLKRISFVFFPNTEELIKGLNDGRVNAAASISPEDMSKVKRDDISVASVTLPRVFGVFFNQAHNPVLADLSARQALDAAVDKEQLTKTILTGRGSVLHSPIPPGLLDDRAPTTPEKVEDITSPATNTQEARLAAAKAILEKGGWSQSSTSTGWKKGDKTLAFTLATADQPQLVATAHAVVADWEQLGVEVQLQIYAVSELNTNIIRTRNYDALLFGEVVGPELDLYAFWHSSQRNDPGLNLAMYANQKIDSILSEARTTTDITNRNSLYREFEKTIMADMPAVFLYAPDFLYIVPDDLSGVELGALKSGAERFENTHQWYIDTEDVWTIFAPLETADFRNN
ncbi:peptide ABC transporter substrate-binding protein [Candidatus Parcubacteria bacterium]|nr:MAG: peptide ABC transporter substrate-binding protein [Candidatus Parcubacteria bacterium]